MNNPNPATKAIALFQKKGGLLRTMDAIRNGIHPRTLYGMRDEGTIIALSRGLYRLRDAPPMNNPDLVAIAVKVPHGVVCLISALSFHNLTTLIPRTVDIAIGRDEKPPRPDYPPVHAYRFSGSAFTEGIEVHLLEGVRVRIYNAEKTLADCFKYRHKIGIDTAIEAVKLYRERKPMNVDAILRYAGICRVSKIMQPYLESLL